MTLPNSKIWIEIPLMKYVMAVNKNQFTDSGIIPDYKVISTTQEKISNKDMELDFAKDLISKGIFKQK